MKRGKKLKKLLQGPANGPTEIYKPFLELLLCVKNTCFGVGRFWRSIAPPPKKKRTKKMNRVKNPFQLYPNMSIYMIIKAISTQLETPTALMLNGS